MNEPLTPATPEALAEAVRAHPRVLAIGARTKPRLSRMPAEVTLISTRALRGMVEYEPDEFTFTARAGTPVREIERELAARGQYLPFDPLWLDAGATLGGTVAAGLSGPGRFRFGGVRDFILGIRFVDGMGRLLRMGGKVVKNCAGFDLPKFMVGGLGRYGALAELSFKVFPLPAARLTLQLPTEGAEAAARVFTEAAGARWECEALAPDRAEALWAEVREFRWAHADGVLAKVALTPAAMPALDAAVRSLKGARLHFSVGGNLAFVSLPPAVALTALPERLRALGLAGLTLRGGAPLWPGRHTIPAIAGAVKQALDPDNRFPPTED